MGYEVKMYIVEKTEQKSHTTGLYWCDVIGMVDLCKIGHYSKVSDLLLLKKQEKTVYFYADDGNTQIDEDLYGDPLYVVDPSLVLDAMKHEQETEKYRRYRRYAIAIPMIQSAIEGFDSDRLKIVFYGH